MLAQEITNGHAARMRFSRFRASLLGLEPQRRNRTNANSKSRVTKKKKDDGPTKPKKDDEEKSSGSGIGNIKAENIKTENKQPNTAVSATIKSERRSISLQLPQPQPSQPPAPMATLAMMKTEQGLVNPYSHRPSILSTASPRIKQERPTTTTTAASNTPAVMPEPVPFGLVTTTNPTTPSTPYLDNYHRMQMRLPTPCGDSDPSGTMQAFLRHSPPPAATDFLHSQHHNHSHNHHHAMVGAGSPPLSTAASSPYDFSQCCDTVVSPAAAAGSPSPWHSQHLHHHSHSHSHGNGHLHSQATTASMFPAFDIGIGTTSAGSTSGGYTLDPTGYNTTNATNTTTTTNNNSNPFCHHHHHPHPHHGQEEDGHHEVDALGLHVGGGGSMFREQRDQRWEGDVYEI